MNQYIIKQTMQDKARQGFFDIPFFAREFLHFPGHNDQNKCLNGMRLKSESGITTGNRWGKGELIMIYGAWFATYKPVEPRFKKKKLHLLNTSISQDQANIVFDKFNEHLLEIPSFSWLIKDIKRNPFPHIIFKTGVTWWFRNASNDGKYLEGRSYAYANFDEADLQRSFPTFLEDILAPRLWDFNGQLTWTTTPRRGRRNAYKQFDKLNSAITAGHSNVYTFQGDSRKNPHLSASARTKMDQLPDRLKNKNVLGIYEDTEGLITNEALDFCETIADGIHTEPIPGRRYVNAYDLARSSTYNVGVTIEVATPLQLRSIERTQDPKKQNRTYWKQICHSIEQRHNKFRGITGIDATGLGDVVASFVNHLNPRLFNFGSNKLRADVIDTGISTILAGEIGLPLNDPQMCVLNKRDGTAWYARDELLDFDEDALDSLIWDFVCALFIGIYIAKGKRQKSSKSKNKRSPITLPRTISGVPKNALS